MSLRAAFVRCIASPRSLAMTFTTLTELDFVHQDASQSAWAKRLKIAFGSFAMSLLFRDI